MTLGMFLQKMGYGEQLKDAIYRDQGVVYWCKKVPGTVKHQFIVRMWPALESKDPTKHFSPSFEVEMTYETRNQIWATTKFYGLSFTELTANLERLEGCLRESLIYMDANPLHYCYDGED